MSNAVFNATKKYSLNGALDWDTDPLYASLHTSAYTPNIDSHAFRSDLSAEVVGAGYTAGGQALTSKVVSQDNTNDRAVFDSDDPTWPGASLTARGVVLSKHRGGPTSADELGPYWDFGADITATAGVFTIIVNVGGWLYLG